MEEEIKETGSQDGQESPSYEDSFTKVEALVKELESGELSLKQSIQKYEDAVKSMNRCYELLDEAQKKIEILIKDAQAGITGRQNIEIE